MRVVLSSIFSAFMCGSRKSRFGYGEGRVGTRRRGLGRCLGRENSRGNEEGFAVGPEARGLPGDVSGGRRVRRVRWVGRRKGLPHRWVRLAWGASGLVCFGLGLQNGFVW